ncbi:putative kinesin [Toxoplasma gondii RUB]|uniref:Kinesin-like protein n=1 Tax=Toxoplasma gondii RUB TaxID=935652 RepID=A0A086LQY8_TOXGO|nr:putative kinesin [Toxoplasma gondii RUB]
MPKSKLATYALPEQHNETTLFLLRNYITKPIAEMSTVARSRCSTSHISPSGLRSSPPLSLMTCLPSSSSPSSFPSSLLSPLAAPPHDLSYPAPQLSSFSAPTLSLHVSPINRTVPDPGEFTSAASSDTRFGPDSLPPCIEQAKSDTRFVTQPGKNIQVVCRLRPIQKEAGNRSLLQNSEQHLVASPPCRANTAFFLQGNSIHVRHPPSLFSSGGTSGGIGGRALQEFTFDYVFGENSSQQAIFERIGRPLVLSVCSGFNATLLAYGQSSSGKTYTIIGDRENDDVLHYGNKHGDEEVKEGREEQSGTAGVEAGGKFSHHPWTTSIEREGAGDKAPGCSARQEEVDEERGDRKLRECDGLLPRMINGIFTWIKANENAAVKRCVRTAAVEIYNENIRDLISGKCGLKVQRQKQNKGSQGGVAIVGLQDKLVREPHEALSVLEKAIKARRAAATRMNADSSRSHFIFCITIQEIVLNTGDSKVGRLTVVDLAGSERVAKTGSMGVMLHEGSMINKSLMCLGKVINALAALAEKSSDAGTSTNAALPSTSSPLPSSSFALPPSSPVQQAPVAVSSLIASSFVPYRDSKLTRVLQDALGGNSNTCLILSCSQDAVHLSESISTLRFGQRAMRVKNSPKMNVKRAHEEAEFRYKKSHQHLEAEYQAFVSSVMGWAESTVLKFAKTQTAKKAKKTKKLLMRKMKRECLPTHQWKMALLVFSLG